MSLLNQTMSGGLTPSALLIKSLQPKLFQYGSVSLHHIPDQYAPSVLVAMLVHAFGLGAVIMDVFGHLYYDAYLLRSSGWRIPSQALCRTAYFACRYGAIANLTLGVLYLNTPNLDCALFFGWTKWIWWTVVCSLDVIFFTRTIALYERATHILCIPIYLAFLVYTSLGTYLVVHFGIAARIPMSRFCAFYLLDSHREPISTIFIVYNVLSTSTTTYVLFLTMYGLKRQSTGYSFRSLLHYTFSPSSRGKRNRHAKRQDEECVYDDGEPNPRRLLSTLLVQGFVLYGTFECVKMLLMISHYTTSNRTAFQLVVFGIIVTACATLSGVLLRQASDVIRETQKTAPISTSFLEERNERDSSCVYYSREQVQKDQVTPRLEEHGKNVKHPLRTTERADLAILDLSSSGLTQSQSAVTVMQRDSVYEQSSSHDGSEMSSFSEVNVAYSIRSNNRVTFDNLKAVGDRRIGMTNMVDDEDIDYHDKMSSSSSYAQSQEDTKAHSYP